MLELPKIPHETRGEICDGVKHVPLRTRQVNLDNFGSCDLAEELKFSCGDCPKANSSRRAGVLADTIRIIQS